MSQDVELDDQDDVGARMVSCLFAWLISVIGAGAAAWATYTTAPGRLGLPAAAVVAVTGFWVAAQAAEHLWQTGWRLTRGPLEASS